MICCTAWGRPERLGRALFPCEGEPVLRKVDAADPLGALQTAAGNSAQADHARAEDDARRAARDFRGVHRSAEPGREPAREQARAVELGLGVDLRKRDLRHHRVLRERGRPHEVPDRLAVAREPRRSVREIALVLLFANSHAQIGAVIAAVFALAALG